MNFESMRVVWDSQNQQRLFAFDHPALEAEIRQRARHIQQRTFWYDVSLVLGTLGGSMVLFGNVVFDDEWHDLPLAAILLALFVYVAMGIWHRRQNEAPIEPNLCSDMDRSISQLDYRIRRQRSFLWWYLVPFALGIAVVLPVHLRGTPPWSWALCVVVFVLMYLSNRAEVKKLEPHKSSLEALKAKLLAEPHQRPETA